MSTPNPEHRLIVTAAVVWLMVWAIGFVGLGFNHVLTRWADSGSPFIVGAVLAAFLASLWLLSSQPESHAALVVNVILAAAVVVVAALFRRNVAMFVVRWTPNRQHDLALFVSRVWVAVVWLSIVSAVAIAEVRLALHSRAR
jgi:hypothetical protein